MAGKRDQQQMALETKGLPAVPKQTQHRVEHDEIDEGSGTSQPNYNRTGNLSYISDEYVFGGGEQGETSEPSSPTSPSNGHNLPSPPPSPPTGDLDNMTSSTPHSKNLPPAPSGARENLQQQRQQQQSPLMSSSIPPKRINSYFNIGRTFPRLVHNAKMTLQKKQKKTPKPDSPHANPLPIVLPTFSPPSPILNQLPSEYFPNDYADDQSIDADTTPDLTIDDLYHLVLNNQKGFQVQIEQMSSQIKELRKEVRRLRGEDSESEPEQEEEEDLDDHMINRSGAETAASARSVTRKMERSGGEGRWYHNESM